MKNKILPLLAISVLSLTACSIFNSLISTSEEVGVYNLDKMQSGDDIEKAHDITINARFKETEPLIPYLTLKQYASLVSKFAQYVLFFHLALIIFPFLHAILPIGPDSLSTK